LFSAIICVVIFFFFSPLAAYEADGNPQLKAMIVDLEKKILDADKRMVAHPSFLKELRTLIDKYKSQLREIFFKDNFKDGNYTKSPKWIVKSGNFFVNKNKKLANSVEIPSYESQTNTEPEQARSVEEQAIGILLNNVFGQKNETKPIEKNPAPSPKSIQPAYIYTKAVFPPAFELTMQFRSTSLTGEMEIVLLGTQRLVPRYRLNLKPDNSMDKPIEVLRESNSRKFVVGAATKFPVINDGKFHTLKWLRLQDGEMHVLIDGKVVLETYEVNYRDNFSGFGIANNGGAFEWNSFKIFKALKPKTN
jgi:hypothetical protein